MKALTFLCLFICVSYVSSAQTEQTPRYGSIRVTVIDASNSQPLPYANVYLNRTTIGGLTDDKGKFELGKIPYGRHELVISALGYKPYQRKLEVQDSLPLYLTVKLVVKMLKEVQVKGKRDDKWNRQYARFERLFLGEEHSKECTITNPWVLNFKKSRREFAADAQEPLNIENQYLGYTLSFELKDFSFHRADYLITGNVKFTEMTSTDTAKTNRWARNREDAYRGSPQHFFRTVIDETLAEEGYQVYNDRTTTPDIIRSANFLTNIGGAGGVLAVHSLWGAVRMPKPNGPYIIELPKRLEVHYVNENVKPTIYRNITHPVSWIEVKDGSIAVNSDGIVQNPQDLTVLGNMGDQRVSEWLPFDYKYVRTYYQKPKPAPTGPVMALLEKPYLHTDRPYYYNNETIWFKGYMNYSAPLLKDTLSQTVYVNLVNEKGELISAKKYPIDNGAFNGDIVLPDKMNPGSYQLKAYTQWMLNFDPGLIFTRTISLLGEKEAVRMAAGFKINTDTTDRVAIYSDKESYTAREKITLTIEALDTLDFPTLANLSVSVTDITQAVPPTNEENILSAYYHIPPVREDSVNVKYNIQYGLDFRGTFHIKNKPQQGILTVYQENMNDTFGMITDEAGRFDQSIYFFDTIRFYVHARSPVNKKGAVIMDSLTYPQAPALAIAPLSLDIYATDQIRQGRFGNKAKMLDEVVVKAKKIESPPNPAVIHNKGDYSVSGDWMTENNVPDLPSALAWKIPGTTIIYGPEPAFIMRSGFGVTGGPLILVDGVEMNGSGSAYEILASIPPQTVERVDVIKYTMASVYGARGAGGIIAVITRKWKPDEAKTTFDKSKLQAVTMAGYSTATKFESPDYSKPDDSGYFDYRPTIFWNPNISTNGVNQATVTFYAGDAITNYRVVVEGVTFDGMAIRGEKVISVTKAR